MTVTDFIGRVIVWVSLLLTGRDPQAQTPSRPTRTAPYPATCNPLPAHRSPRQRRRELAMAALGLDVPGPYWVRGLEVA